MASAMPPEIPKSVQRTLGGVGRSVLRAPAETVTYERPPTMYVLARYAIRHGTTSTTLMTAAAGKSFMPMICA